MAVDQPELSPAQLRAVFYLTAPCLPDQILEHRARVAESVDAADSKSASRT